MINIHLIKIAVADKNDIFRTGIRITLDKNEQFSVIWEASDVPGIMHQIKESVPDVLLMDMGMTDTATIEAISTMRRLYNDLRIIVVSDENDPTVIAKIMQLGANAFLTKKTELKEIEEAILTCVKDEFYFNDLVNNAVLTKVNSKRRSYQQVKFTEREVSILKLIADDKNTEEISKQVFLSPRTIEAIRQSMKCKVGAKTTAGLVIYGLRNSLIS